MSHSQRFTNLLDAEKIRVAGFCKISGYNHRSLSEYVNKKTEYPKLNLVIAVATYFPHWNIRYWVIGEGDMFITKESLSSAEAEAKSKLQEEEFKELLKLRGLKEAYDKLLDKLPELMKNQK